MKLVKGTLFRELLALLAAVAVLSCIVFAAPENLPETAEENTALDNTSTEAENALLTGDTEVPGEISEEQDAEDADTQTAEEEKETSPAPAISLDEDNEKDTIYITVPFVIIGGHTFEWEFPYSDNYFRHPSSEFHLGLARASMGLEYSAFRNDKYDLENQLETYLGGAGFTDLYSFGYDQPTSQDSLSGIIGSRKIDDFTLIAAAPCGQGYGNEWAGNLEVGDEERHVGFNKAARVFEEQILNYIEEHNITGKIKLWLAGFSRASAVSNITAADMIDSGVFEDVYAYLLAVPRTVKKPGDYEGIYNICGKFDPIPDIPMETWGYERYGTDLFTPAQEVDSNYLDLYIAASEVSYQLTGDYFRNNPEVNYQLHLILEFLADIFPTSTDYKEHLQDDLIAAWSTPDPDHFAEVLLSVFSQMDDTDIEEGNNISVFMDYLQYIVSDYLRGNQRQVDSGAWDENESIGFNMFREHLPSVYLDWIFSDIDENELFELFGVTRRLIVSGDVKVSVYEGDDYVCSIDKDGTSDYGLWSGRSEKADLPVLYMFHSGSLTMINVPMDRDYRVLIETDMNEQIYYYSVVFSEDVLVGVADKLYYVNLDKGEYQFRTQAYERQVSELEVLSGAINSNTVIEMEYAPQILMIEESTSVSHLTLGSVIEILLIVPLIILLLLIVNAIIGIVHKIRKKKILEKKGRGYSPWWIIIPHLVVIVMFSVLTQYLVLNFYKIGAAKTASAAAAVFIVFLLELRALFRNKTIPNLVYTVLLVILIVYINMYFKNTIFATYSLLSMILYYAGMTLLTVLAILGFYVKKGKLKSRKE